MLLSDSILRLMWKTVWWAGLGRWCSLAVHCDVLTGDTPNNIQVTVGGVVNENNRKSTFNTQVQGGQRLILPELTDPGRLKVGNITNLLGSSTGFRFVGKQ